MTCILGKLRNATDVKIMANPALCLPYMTDKLLEI